MDRIVRLSLFSVGLFIGSMCVILSGRSAEDSARIHAEQAPSDREAATNREASQTGDAEIAARVSQRAKRRAEFITAAAAGEADDPDWAPAAERRIAERFAARAPAGFKLRSAICKTSLCIAEIEAPSREASAEQSGWHRFLGASRGFVYHRGEEEGSFRTVVFIARDGHGFPDGDGDPRRVAVTR